MSFSICLDTQIYDGPQLDRGCKKTLLTSDSRRRKSFSSPLGFLPLILLDWVTRRSRIPQDLARVDLGGPVGLKGPFSSICLSTQVVPFLKNDFVC